MTSTYLLTMGLTVAANVAYHFCQKGIAHDVNPLVSLFVTYATAMAVTLVAWVAWPSNGEPVWSAAAWGRVNWASYGLGFAAVGLELGFLWVYRVGWKLSFAALCSNVLVTLALVPVGLLVFHEQLSLRKGAGILVAVSGLWLIAG